MFLFSTTTTLLVFTIFDLYCCNNDTHQRCNYHLYQGLVCNWNRDFGPFSKFIYLLFCFYFVEQHIVKVFSLSILRMPTRTHFEPPLPANSKTTGMHQTLLYSGSKFSGCQKSKGNSYDVEVNLQVTHLCLVGWNSYKQKKVNTSFWTFSSMWTWRIRICVAIWR